MKRSVLFLIMLMFCGLFPELKAQDYQFTQFYSSPTILAPSFTGLTNGSRVALNYRDQWPSIPGTFTTYALAYDHYFSRINSGFGVNVVRDEAGVGPLARTTVALLYSYDFSVTRKLHIRPGINLNYTQSSLGFRNLVFGDQLNLTQENTELSIETKPNENRTYLDASASVIAYTSAYWGGISFDHMFRPNNSFYGEVQPSRVPLKVSLFGGYKIDLAPRARDYDESVMLAFLYKNKVGEQHDQLDLGVYWTKTPIVIGAWFRGIPVMAKRSGVKYENIDAIIFLVGYKISNLQIGYSYDFTISDLMNHTGGSHEISIVYEFNQNLRMSRHRKKAPIACPDF